MLALGCVPGGNAVPHADGSRLLTVLNVTCPVSWSGCVTSTHGTSPAATTTAPNSLWDAKGSQDTHETGAVWRRDRTLG